MSPPHPPLPWDLALHITHWPSRKRGRNAGYSTPGPPPPSPKYGLLPMSHHIFVKNYIAPSKEWRCIWRQHMYKRLVPCGCIHINHNLNCLQITVQTLSTVHSNNGTGIREWGESGKEWSRKEGKRYFMLASLDRFLHKYFCKTDWQSTSNIFAGGGWGGIGEKTKASDFGKYW